MSKSTDLIVPGDDSKYLVLSTPQDELNEIIADTFAPGEGLSMRDLTRIKVPAGGATAFAVPNIETGEEDFVKEVSGIIIRRDTARTYWIKSFEDGDGERPDCSSRDGITGHLREDTELTAIPDGQACASCPFNAFETATKGKGKACAENRLIYMLQPDSLLPIVIKTPPSSLGNAKDYFVGLMKLKLMAHKVETKVRLVKATSNGIDYAQMVFSMGDRLSPEAIAQVKAYADGLAPGLDANTAAEAAADRDE